MTTRVPKPPARCLSLLERLSDYIDVALTTRQRRAIEAHCQDCARCRQMIASLRRTIVLYRRSGNTSMPPAARARARERINRLLKGTR